VHACGVCMCVCVFVSSIHSMYLSLVALPIVQYRTAVNAQSGVKTQLGGIFTGKYLVEPFKRFILILHIHTHACMHALHCMYITFYRTALNHYG